MTFWEYKSPRISVIFDICFMFFIAVLGKFKCIDFPLIVCITKIFINIAIDVIYMVIIDSSRKCPFCIKIKICRCYWIILYTSLNFIYIFVEIRIFKSNIIIIIRKSETVVMLTITRIGIMCLETIVLWVRVIEPIILLLLI